MFIKITDKDNLVKEVTNKIEKEVVFHYICDNCDDEQVTDPLEITDDIISTLENEGCIYIGLPCTNCGCRTIKITPEDILGIEEL